MPQPPSWEFLLQQDGDRAWLPIETPNVEILEGRYRIAAKSRYKNAPVEVCIKHDAINEDPPKRRTQKRKNQTNAQGLMVVIPFTDLLPGIWEFSCTSSDPMVELLDEPWTYSVQFNVLPLEVDTIEDWDAIWDMALEDGDPLDLPVMEAPQLITAPQSTIEFSPKSAEEISAVEVAVPPVKMPLEANSVEEMLRAAERLSDDMADEVLTEYGLSVEESEPQPISLPIAPVELPPLSIALVQDTYIARRGQTLTLSGKILSSAQAEMPLVLTHAELSVCLRDPQSAEILLETREIIENQFLPSDLTYQLTLPSVLKTRLIIGEITLRDVMEAGTPILASQTFTLTADVQELLDAVATERVIAEEVVEGVPNQPKQASPLNLTFLNFVQSPKPESSETFAPAVKQPLPPKLTPPNSSTQAKRKLDLPTFGEAAAPSPRDRADEPTQLEIPLPELTATPEPPQASLEDEVKQLEIALNPPEDNFEALQTETRFLDRLNSLAEDADLSEELKALADDSPGLSPPEEIVGLLPPFTIDIQPNPDPVESEYVVDDEPILPLADLVISRRQKFSQTENAPNPLMIPENEPVPTPVLSIAPDQLIAGKPLTISVKLPDILPKIYVKVWINDRQSRALLEPSRWLTDFHPNGLGKLEASIDLTVPLGSVEIQVEAIAVEVMTSRESHKVSVDRPVVPTNEPDFSIEDFEV